ncbi:hypothetical protein DS745_14595 [Anaerobacillus alkaliphilus]|uniref:Uncharacterized protein n=1 Tax=Anaerobacillus alkaliphilus TaxID=1548597 RepID=A0A4Q0VS91_9BACI|nr:hypothetical protein [Anaerobacillus alkaliphilus]RXI99449.1 hypothetical protein DS745_14595 [Anaerobacillus alkaliphilus]
MKVKYRHELRKLTYGIWIDGNFTWLNDKGWMIETKSEEHIELTHHELSIEVTMKTKVYNEGTIQYFLIKNLSSNKDREIKLFLRQNLMENADESITFYAPCIQAIVRSYNDQYLLLNGLMNNRGIVQYCTDFTECDLSAEGIVLLQPFSLSSEESILSIEGTIKENENIEGYFWLCTGGDEEEVIKNNSIIQLYLPDEVLTTGLCSK